MRLFTLNSTKRLQKKYQSLLLQARDLQREGQIRSAAQAHAEAELVLVRIRKHNQEL